MENLFEALVVRTTGSRSTLFTDPRRQEQADKWLQFHCSSQARQKLQMQSLLDVRRAGPDIDVWLNLSGSAVHALQLRRACSRLVYPIITVQHGLSIHTFLYERFLRLLLTPHYACDSIVCSSFSSAAAVKKIMNRVAETFNSEFESRVQFMGRVDPLRRHRRVPAGRQTRRS